MNDFSTIKPKPYDTYIMKGLSYTHGNDDTYDVAIHIQSTTTGRPFVIRRKITDEGKSYKKEYISKFIKYFISVSRIEFSPSGFEKLNRNITNKEVLLRMETALKGVARKKIESIIKKINTQLSTFKEPLEVLPKSYFELKEMEQTPQVAYSMLIRSREYYTKKLNVQFFSDKEYRTFYKANKVPQAPNTEVQPYHLSPTKTCTLITSFQLRADDSVYCAVYDTMTQKTIATMNTREIVGFLLANLDNLIITDYKASLQLQALLNGIPIANKTELELKKALDNLTNARKLHIDTITNFLDTTSRPDFVERECHNVMRVNIKHDEALNCIQHLENMKYLFDTRLKEHVASRHLAILTARKKGMSSVLTMSELSDALFFNGEVSTYKFDMYSLLNNNNLLVNSKVNNFLLEVADEEEESEEAIFNDFAEMLDLPKEDKRHVFSDLGIDLTTGKSGYGGLRGYIPNYHNPQGTKVVHLDFRSFYPTILLDLNTEICHNIDLGTYLSFYNKKFSEETSVMAKTFYKQLINTAIGVLGSSKDKFSMRSRDTWKAIIKVGQLTMLNLLYNLEQQGAKILHVNTDGCYVEVPQDVTLDITHKYPLSIETYSDIYISNLNDYMVGSEEKVICKGKYKHMDCSFVTQLVVAKLLFNKDYSSVPCQLEDCYLYSRDTQSRTLHLTEGFVNYEVDVRTLDYINDYNARQIDKHVTLDKEAYYRIADSYLY